uniref:Uncharacterized protein n=1 Tax=Oryza rufipogon TaxID=4529 RepID=A0A2I4S610_ORYRU|nr:hypothetical protein YJ_10 [Oryza rufipogon]
MARPLPGGALPGPWRGPLPSLRSARREACGGGGAAPLNPAAAQRQMEIL